MIINDLQSLLNHSYKLFAYLSLAYLLIYYLVIYLLEMKGKNVFRKKLDTIKFYLVRAGQARCVPTTLISRLKKFLESTQKPCVELGKVYPINVKSISYTSGRHGRFLCVFGMTFAHNPWGNCFKPALIVDTVGINSKPWFSNRSYTMCYPAKIIVTFRSRGFVETSIYWRGWFRFDWNSGHLARWFGKFEDTDSGGYMRWKHHLDL